MSEPRPNPSPAAHPALVLKRILSGVNAKKLEQVYFQLATMLAAGVSIRDALHTLAEQNGGRIGRRLLELDDWVGKGGLLSEAMGRRPEVFDKVALALVRAGELTGRLDDNLRIISESMGRVREVKSRMATALLYPVILLHLGVFIPNLVILITRGTLPYLETCLGILFPMYAILAFLWFLHQVLRETKTYSELVLGMLLFGKVAKKVALSRFAVSLAALYDAGVPVDRAVETAGDATGNGALREVFGGIARRLQGGESLAATFRTARHIPDLVRNMVETGETSGRLGESLRKIAEYYDHEAGHAIRRMARVIPLLIYLAIMGYLAWQIIDFYLNRYGKWL